MILNEKITLLAQKAISSESQFLLEVVVSSKNGPKKVTVILDGDQPVTIDDCAAVSRELVKLIDEEKLMEEEGYALEVTTPGVDHPLKLRRQYVRNIGRSLKVLLKDKRTEHGILTGVTADGIEIEQIESAGKKAVKKQQTVLFEDIERAIVQVSFK